MTYFDKDLVKRRFASHLKEYDELSVVQRDICERLAEKLLLHTSQPLHGYGYEIGAGTGFLTKYMLKNYPQLKWYINDLVPEAETYIDPIVKQNEAQNVVYLWQDAEKMRLTKDVSLLVSSSAMQWFNSIEHYLDDIYPQISDGGVVAFSIFGQRNFHQVRESSGGIGLDYPTVDEVIIWAERIGFEVLLAEDYQQTIYFEDPSAVLSYIKQSGMNGNSSRKWTKSDFERFCDYYTTHFSENNAVSLTFNPIQFILKK